MKKKYVSAFDRMMDGLNAGIGDECLEDCMKMDAGIMKNIPRRYRLIALGFVKKYSLEQLNQRLLNDGCERLYARNRLEAELIYAFVVGLTYEEWKEMHNRIAASENAATHPSGPLNGKNLCLASLKDYIILGSEKGNGLNTLHVTRKLEKKIMKLPEDEKKFVAFLQENDEHFSEVREKARYYFCKYLCAYLESIIFNCSEAAANKETNKKAWEEALCDMSVLKGLTTLKRKKMTPAETVQFLNHAPLSCGGIYDAFNYFYFEYVSCDWMHALIEYFGEPSLLPKEKKEALAKAIRTYHPDWKELDDDEAIRKEYEEEEREEQLLDEAYSLSGTSHGYQRNRRGEKSIRNYITGTLDIDRTTLICYLIFFNQNTNYNLVNRVVQPITPQRLNDILDECGFSRLRWEDDFDSFIMEYLHVDDPVGYLMESVTKYALENKNFFLYHMYNVSVKNQEQLEKLLK